MSVAYAVPAVPVVAALLLLVLPAGSSRAALDRWAAAVVVAGTVAAALLSEASGLALLAAGLAALDAALRRWAAPTDAAPTAAGQLRLAAVLLAAVAPAGLASWGAVVLMAALCPAADPMRNTLTGAALALSLFGLLAAGADPPLGFGCRLIGDSALFAMLPPLLALAPVFLLRIAPAAGTPEGVSLLAAGLVALSGCGLLIRLRRPACPHLMALGHLGLAAAAMGTGTEAGRFAALVLAILVPLGASAAVWPHRAGWLALGGIPPLGTFGGIMLCLMALNTVSPWLAAAAMPGLLAIGWTALVQGAAHHAGRPVTPLAWVPIGLTVVIGLLLPEPASQWLRALARIGP